MEAFDSNLEHAMTSFPKIKKAIRVPVSINFRVQNKATQCTSKKKVRTRKQSKGRWSMRKKRSIECFISWSVGGRYDTLIHIDQVGFYLKLLNRVCIKKYCITQVLSTYWLTTYFVKGEKENMFNNETKLRILV